MRLRVKLKDRVPHNSKQSHKCYLAVSVNNPVYQQQVKIAKLIEWVSQRYDDCIILIGDFLNRINAKIYMNVSEEQAATMSIKEGDKIESSFHEAFEGNLLAQFQILRWKTMFENGLVQQRKSSLHQIYQSHPNFRQRINEHSEYFLSQQKRKGKDIVIDVTQAIQLSAEYLLEELAVFSVMIENGYTVQIYPGTTLGILKEFASGEILNVDTFLENGCFIDISIKRG